MTGPQHYVESQRLLKQAADSWGMTESGDPYPNAARLLAEAQVHATLALAAATVANGIKVYDGENEHWQEAMSPDGAIR